ncbi:hypothetical protein HC891_18615, partial [Candidatus Gracilibacteria bacterium]|nr:hypothetical protein [Candidatus Gracilibacteria bacterium]
MAYSALIGAEVKRKEDPRLITGSGSYVADIHLPGMAFVAIVRSPYAHARIGAIDSAVKVTRAWKQWLDKVDGEVPRGGFHGHGASRGLPDRNVTAR